MKKEDLLMAALAFGAVVGLGMWWKTTKAAAPDSSALSSLGARRYTPSTSSTSTGALPGYAGFGALPQDWDTYNTDALSGYFPSWVNDNPYG